MKSSLLKPNVTVIGCGVTGLTSGIRLREAGFSVKIIAREKTPHTTSDITPAVWYPYLPEIENEKVKEKYKKRVERWVSLTYEEGCKLAKRPKKTGVKLIDFTRLFREKMKKKKFKKEFWWKEFVLAFERKENNFPPGYVDGYSMKTPLFETPFHMPYLFERFKESGGVFEQNCVRKISDLCDEDQLIVNCAGLGARKLVGDKKLYAKRGQIIKVKASGVDGCFIDETPSDHTDTFGYIVPRTEDCILGGTAEEHDYDVEPDCETAKEIEKRCKLLAPNLKIEEILEHKVGLRPERKMVRLEMSYVPGYKRCAVIHNYGHSGSGFTLSWGCAAEVTELAQKFSA